ncbi:MAG: hypothetical protein GF353_20995 [Candidatus Lokiarchaeota archaeon]|nr:hypothetical protein [Candidatus Lokiarchaeota archaeon]
MYNVVLVADDKNIKLVDSGIGIHNLMRALRKKFPEEFLEKGKSLQNLTESEKKQLVIILKTEVN